MSLPATSLVVRCLLIAIATAPATAMAEKPHVVMVIAEREYLTNETLAAFADSRLQDYRCTFVYEAPEDRNALAGVEAVAEADVLVVSVRRRTLPPQQLKIIRDYVAAGKPVLGIRTASHAFSLRNSDAPKGRAVWPEFDRQVFGGNYTNHHGNALKATIRLVENIGEDASALLKGLESHEPFPSSGSLYRVSPLAEGAQILLTGSVEGHPEEPVAWTMIRQDGGKSFYTSLGHVDDFQGDVLPQLLINAIEWSLQ